MVKYFITKDKRQKNIIVNIFVSDWLVIYLVHRSTFDFEVTSYAYTLTPGWGARGLMVKAMDCEIVVSSYSSRTITFTVGQILFGKVWTPLSSQLWVK